MEKPRDERILFLFRHGETDWNREGRLQGHTDTPLNANGLAQAEALADSLRPHRLDAVVSSDLTRARTTAQIVADTLRVPLFIEPAIARDRCRRGRGPPVGGGQDALREGLTERWYSDGDVAFPGGETGIATRTRGLGGLRRFTGAQPFRRIGVSTHGAMVRQLMKHALPPGSAPAPVRNTTLYVLRYQRATDRLMVVEREELELD